MKRILVFVAMVLSTGLAVHAQSACVGLKNPTNFNLYSAYKGQVGTKPSLAPNAQTGVTGMTFTGAVLSNTQLATTGESSSCNVGHFRIMSSSEGNDPNTSNTLPVVPTGFTHSIRVGNCSTGAEAEALYYDMTVSPQNAMLYLYFAIVIQAPGHGVAQDPTFVLRVSVDTSTSNTGSYTCNQIHHDTSCYMVPSTNVSNGVNGWHTVGSSYNTVAYRDWEMACINLYDYLYRHIRIEVMIGDCSQSGHYGYCYFAGDCKPMTMSVSGCNSGSSDTVGIATVPTGMSSYQWYRSKTGVRTDKLLANYSLIQGGTDSVLAVHSSDFVHEISGDTLFQNTFLCKLTTYMDPTKPLQSEMLATINNMKPVLAVDSILGCDHSVTLKNISQVVFDNYDQRNQVDTSRSIWNFYDAEQPVGTPVFTDTGYSATHRFTAAGPHSATLRTYTYRTDTVCYNEKSIHIRALTPPVVNIELSDQNICSGDSVYLYDRTAGSTYHRWVITQGDSLIADTVTRTAVLPKWAYDTTTHVTLYSHTSQVTYRDTNEDGIVDAVHCIGQADTDIVVQQYPSITVTGETVVCKGTPANAVANALDEHGAAYAGCTYNWYEMLHGTTPIATDATLNREITGDKIFYVTATTTFGCTTWDSVTLMLVDPRLEVDKNKICTGDTVMMWGSKAAKYEWSATPNDDATFWGQETNDTVIVSPLHTTTYTLVGKGSNGCGATEIRQKIAVYDYPIPTIQLTPDYIDSENPRVQFNDVSPNGTNSLWNFGNGETSTSRSVVHTFTNLDEDSLLITLNSCNPLGCCNDTMFYIPVGIFSVWYPNAFTPRLETNNTFHAYTKNVLVDYEIYIYNRQGALVFHSVDPQQGWDGFCNGKACPEGSYVYIATYKRDDGSTRTMSQKGTVLLLR